MSIRQEIKVEEGSPSKDGMELYDLSISSEENIGYNYDDLI